MSDKAWNVKVVKLGSTIEHQERELARLGWQEWELVAIHASNGSTPVAYLKREARG